MKFINDKNIYNCLLSVFIGIIYFSLHNHPTYQVLLFPLLWIRKQAQRGEVLVECHRANKSINVGHGLGFWFHVQCLFSSPTAVFRIEKLWGSYVSVVGSKVGASGITCLKIWGLSRKGIMWGELVKITCRPPSVYQVMRLPILLYVNISPGIDQQSRGELYFKRYLTGLDFT